MKVKISQSCPTLCDAMDYTVHGILQVRILEWVAFFSPGDLPNPGIKLRSSALQADSLLAEPQGKPKNTGVGCRGPAPVGPGKFEGDTASVNTLALIKY